MSKFYVVVNDTVGSDYFDSNLYPVLLALLPLNEAYTREISIYDSNLYGKKGVMKAIV
jgi:hypothetical protein